MAVYVFTDIINDPEPIPCLFIYILITVKDIIVLHNLYKLYEDGLSVLYLHEIPLNIQGKNSMAIRQSEQA